MFETSSGSLRKPVKKEGHSHGEYLITKHRTAATTNPNCQRAYTPAKNTYDRTTPLSSKELLARGRFAAVAAAVKVRSKDLMQISADQAAFVAQKDLPDGKKTMKAYLWKVCGDIYDAQHS